MLFPTEAITTPPKLLPQRRQYLPRWQSLPRRQVLPRRQDFPRINPPSVRESPDPTSRTPESSQHGSHWLSPGYSRTYDHTSIQKGRVSPNSRGVVTPPSDLAETSASPTRVSAAVTEMFHTLQSVTIRPRRTLPDSAGLPPGLSSTTMGPFRQDPLLTRKG